MKGVILLKRIRNGYDQDINRRIIFGASLRSFFMASLLAPLMAYATYVLATFWTELDMTWENAPRAIIISFVVPFCLMFSAYFLLERSFSIDSRFYLADFPLKRPVDYLSLIIIIPSGCIPLIISKLLMTRAEKRFNLEFKHQFEPNQAPDNIAQGFPGLEMQMAYIKIRQADAENRQIRLDTQIDAINKRLTLATVEYESLKADCAKRIRDLEHLKEFKRNLPPAFIQTDEASVSKEWFELIELPEVVSINIIGKKISVDFDITVICASNVISHSGAITEYFIGRYNLTMSPTATDCRRRISGLRPGWTEHAASSYDSMSTINDACRYFVEQAQYVAAVKEAIRRLSSLAYRNNHDIEMIPCLYYPVSDMQ